MRSVGSFLFHSAAKGKMESRIEGSILGFCDAGICKQVWRYFFKRNVKRVYSDYDLKTQKENLFQNGEDRARFIRQKLQGAVDQRDGLLGETRP